MVLIPLRKEILDYASVPLSKLLSGLVCTSCSETYPPSEKSLVCLKCRGILDVTYDFDKLKKLSKDSVADRVHSLWRYTEFLPINELAHIVSLSEGFTPLLQAPRYGESINLKGLMLKAEYNNPTGSFKDRGSTVSVSRLNSLSINSALDDSSGNAGSSLAAYCARAGIQCTIYAPATASAEKLVQAETYGATIVRILGSRADVAKAAENAWRTSEIYYASHVLSPFFLEGTKTFALEIAEVQKWTVPDHIVFPVGGGTLILGAWKGFRELEQLGWIERIPKLHCVQSQACMPIVESLRKNHTEVEPVPEGETVAGGIRIANPVRGKEILEALRKTEGQAVAVSDEAILKQQRLLAKCEGIFVEPTSSAALAGLVKLSEMGKISAEDTVVVPLTGNGLKDVQTAMRNLS